jgi:hypothetical protein
MVAYCFSTADGRVVDRYFPMGKAPSNVALEDGALAERDFAAEHAPRRSCGGWPMECYASGVHASQAGELREFFRQRGENVEVTKDGDPVYTSASQRKRLLKLRGFVDKSAYC